MEFAGYIWDFTAIAAFTAAAVALFGVWRGNRTAKINLSATLDLEIIRFREQWIQNLREEMSTVGGYLANVTNLTPEQVVELSKANLKMLLLMNPEDEDYEELRIMTKMLHRSAATGKAAQKPKNEETFKFSDFTRICQRILKREWVRMNKEVNQYKNSKKKNNAKNK